MVRLCFSTCIFCGEKNEDFVRDGLEQHYWSNCPMLRRCQECNQVASLGFSRSIDSRVVLGHRSGHLHRSFTPWMWKERQVSAMCTMHRSHRSRLRCSHQAEGMSRSQTAHHAVSIVSHEYSRWWWTMAWSSDGSWWLHEESTADSSIEEKFDFDPNSVLWNWDDSFRR